MTANLDMTGGMLFAGAVAAALAPDARPRAGASPGRGSGRARRAHSGEPFRDVILADCPAKARQAVEAAFDHRSRHRLPPRPPLPRSSPRPGPSAPALPPERGNADRADRPRQRHRTLLRSAPGPPGRRRSSSPIRSAARSRCGTHRSRPSATATAASATTFAATAARDRSTSQSPSTISPPTFSASSTRSTSTQPISSAFRSAACSARPSPSPIRSGSGASTLVSTTRLHAAAGILARPRRHGSRRRHRRGRRRRHPALVHAGLHRPRSRRSSPASASASRRPTPPATPAAARRSAAWTSASASARSRAPTLIIVGADDPATPPAMAEDLRQRIPGAEMVVISERLAHHLGRAGRCGDRPARRLPRPPRSRTPRPAPSPGASPPAAPFLATTMSNARSTGPAPSPCRGRTSSPAMPGTTSGATRRCRARPARC